MPIAAAFLVFVGFLVSQQAFGAPSRERKPNIVLILTDDQDVELGSLNFMPKTLRAIRAQGAEFRHAYVTTPMCCPSRSSLLTGMYVHNHHVYTNNDNCSSTHWQATHETRSFATYLSNAGYRTGYFGKYLNKYNGSYVPPGWREWGGLIMNSKYYNYSINMNGKKIKHGFDYHKDYYPDLIANDSIAFLRQSKKNSAHKPVMLTMSFPAPHGPEDSAPQYSELFFNVTTHHTPSYDYAPNPDKQWILQVTQKMQPIHKQFTDLLMTKRLQTLQSVDHAVDMVVKELERLGELNNTYVIYTSDHGYHLGQFGLIKGKSFPFEFDVRVPFLVRGPGVEPGTVVDDIVLNIDLAPTFLDIAGVEAPNHMDGKSVLPLFLNSKRKRIKWQDTFLIESSGRRETPYFDAKLKNNRRNMTTEAPITISTVSPQDDLDYSISISSIGYHRPITTAAPISRIDESGEDLLLGGESIVDDEDDLDDDDFDIDLDDEEIDDDRDAKNGFKGEDNDMIQLETKDLPTLLSNKVERLALECAQDEMKLPCHANQKWYCFNDNGRWRKHKCKSILDNNNPLPSANNKNFRKCACFTTTGLVYRKIPLRNITRRHTSFKLDRIKRDADLSNILFKRLEFGEDGEIPGRVKRDTLAHVEHVMKDVQGKLKGLTGEDGSPPSIDDTNTISQSSSSSLGCIFSGKGRVNCSENIYQDRKRWRQSRHQIDNQIQELKEKLIQLKEIRKHLKDTKRIIFENKDEHKIDNTSEINELNNFHVNHENETRKRKRKRPVIDQNPSTTATTTRINSKRMRFDDDNLTTTITTHSPVTNHYNNQHHRHNHNLNNRLSTTQRPFKTKYNNDYCHCEPEEIETAKTDHEKETRRRIKDEKLRRKLRKQRKKDQLEKECSSERMNCFHHDNEHWKTAPMWTEGPFCFCMNANNNTYSCVRTINATHNFLYCEFTTGLVTFYNLRINPYELQNRIEHLKHEERSYLHEQLKKLIACRGKSCNNNNNHAKSKQQYATLPVHFSPNRFRNKRKYINELQGRGVGDTFKVKVNTREQGNINSKNNTAMFAILRETGIKRNRRKIYNNS